MSSREDFLNKLLVVALFNRATIVEDLYDELRSGDNPRVNLLAEKLVDINKDIAYCEREIKKEQCK